jgi:hypothetical protein
MYNRKNDLGWASFRPRPRSSPYFSQAQPLSSSKQINSQIILIPNSRSVWMEHVIHHPRHSWWPKAICTVLPRSHGSPHGAFAWKTIRVRGATACLPSARSKREQNGPHQSLPVRGAAGPVAWETWMPVSWHTLPLALSTFPGRPPDPQATRTHVGGQLVSTYALRPKIFTPFDF